MNRTLKEPRLILASASPRRRALLVEAGLAFDVVAPRTEEPGQALGGLAPERQAEALAYFKARSVWEEHQEALVLGADTLVALGEEVLGKADSPDHAAELLRRLSGTRHRVITGVALLGPQRSRLIASRTTFVTMRPMSPARIRKYVDSGEWKGKAGAYALQQTADRYVERIEGSFSNVVGLPVELVREMLAEMRRNPDKHRFP